MDNTKESCGNCGHFLEFYAFIGGTHFRPVNCGLCKLKNVNKKCNEMERCCCDNWVSNKELLEKRNYLTESVLQEISRKLYDFMLFLIAKES